MRLTTQRRWLVPAVLAALLVGELSTGAVAAVHQRADLAEARRIAAEKRATAMFIAGLRPVANKVFDAVQPLQDVDDAFQSPVFGLAAVRDDVLARTGVVRELAAARTVLGTLSVPAAYGKQRQPLRAAIDQLSHAAGELAHATTLKGDRTGYVAQFSDGFTDLWVAEHAWGDALAAIDGGDILPAPGNGGGRLNGYAPVTRGHFVYASDRACVAAFASDARLPRYQGADVVLHGFPQLAKELRTLAKGLRGVKAPASRSAVQRALAVGLPATVSLASKYDGLARALAHRDQAALTKDLQDLQGAFQPLRDLGRAFRAEGATICADYFDVNEQGKAKAGNPTLGA